MEGAFTGAKINSLVRGVLADRRQPGSLEPFLHGRHVHVAHGPRQIGLGRADRIGLARAGHRFHQQRRTQHLVIREQFLEFRGLPQCHQGVGEVGPQIALLLRWQ